MIASKLKRTDKAVSTRAKVLGLRKVKQRKVWAPAELKKLRKLYPDTKTDKLVDIFGCSVRSIYRQAKTHGITKSAAYLATPDACRLRRGEHVGKQFWFPKGHVPANKGLRRPGYARGRMRETQFKKGAKPQTWKPIGTEVVDAYGYLKRKVRDGMKPAVYNWDFVHRLLWTEHHGPVPKGHIVAFKDGNKTNIVIENLELRSHGQNMRHNSIHNLPPELRQVIQLTGAVRAHVTRRQRREEQDRGSEKSSVRDARGTKGQRRSDANRPRQSNRGHRTNDRQQRKGRG
ncbi:MAG: HNH endonuclease signature motif containing protein [Gammaproteobacteria bacterium]